MAKLLCYAYNLTGVNLSSLFTYKLHFFLIDTRTHPQTKKHNKLTRTHTLTDAGKSMYSLSLGVLLS